MTDSSQSPANQQTASLAWDDNVCEHYIPDPETRCRICHPEIARLQTHSGTECDEGSGE